MPPVSLESKLTGHKLNETTKKVCSQSTKNWCCSSPLEKNQRCRRASIHFHSVCARNLLSELRPTSERPWLFLAFPLFCTIISPKKALSHCVRGLLRTYAEHAQEILALIHSKVFWLSLTCLFCLWRNSDLLGILSCIHSLSSAALASLFFFGVAKVLSHKLGKLCIDTAPLPPSPPPPPWDRK